MSDELKYYFVVGGTVLALVVCSILFVDAMDSHYTEQGKTRYAAYCKITGNPSNLTFEEWFLVKHRLSWEKPKEEKP